MGGAGVGPARDRADALAQALLDRGLGPDRPLMVLSGNAHRAPAADAAAYTAGVPILPVSAAYSLLQPRSRAAPGASWPCATRAWCSPTTPSASRRRWTPPAGDGGRVARGARGRAALPRPGRDRARGGGRARRSRRSGPTRWPRSSSPPARRARRRASQHAPDAVLQPAGARRRSGRSCATSRPCCVDWLPWSHTFGANHNLGQVLAFGGTLYIDDGKPAPGAVRPHRARPRARSRPTLYYNVPAGFALLAPRLEERPRRCGGVLLPPALHVLRRRGAARALWDRLRAVADARGRAPGAADRVVGDDRDRAGGDDGALRERALRRASACRCPGVTLKLVPTGEKLEIRLTRAKRHARLPRQP